MCYAQRPAHLAEMLASALAQRPEGLAVVCGDMRLSWRELHHAATKCAGGLALRGVLPGDRVAMHLGNTPEFIIVTLACAWMGAVLVPVSSRARGMELEYVLSDSGAVALVCAPDVAQWQPAPDLLPALRMRFVTGTASAEGFEPFSSLVQAQAQTQAHPAQEEDLAVLLYTSGTTGRPKGAMLTQLNIVHSVMHFVERMGLDERDISLLAVPMSHVTGLVAQLYTMLYCQGTAVVMAQFRAADFVRLASAERISHTIMVPAMYNLCLLMPDLQAHDLGAWRIGAYGGASMPTATIDGLAQRLPGLVLMNAYGATETCSPATIMPQGQTDSHRDGKEECLSPVALGEAVDHEHQGNHHQHESQHQPRELRDPPVEGCRRLRLRKRIGHAAEIRLLPRGDHHGRPRPALHARAEKRQARELHGDTTCRNQKVKRCS
jgi:acyl-CoA synthetase (AMP-forming)/AMP-acid ligase II